MKLFTKTIITLTAASLLPLSAYANRPDAPGITARVAQIYKPYKTEASNTPWWKYPIFSAGLRNLIRQWEAARAGVKDEVGSIDGGDWLCDCQEYDAKTFRVTVDTVQVLPSGKSQAAITIRKGWGESSKQRFIMVNEKGRWEVEDILPMNSQKGLQAALRSEIADSMKRK